MSAQHPFVTWLVEHHGKADTPVGDFARDLHHAPQFPRSGGREELRAYLEDIGADLWVLDVFDYAWELYKPICSWRGCTKAAGGASSYCPEHALADLL